jgi:hypothetical protein
LSIMMNRIVASPANVNIYALVEQRGAGSTRRIRGALLKAFCGTTFTDDA